MALLFFYLLPNWDGTPGGSEQGPVILNIFFLPFVGCCPATFTKNTLFGSNRSLDLLLSLMKTPPVFFMND